MPAPAADCAMDPDASSAAPVTSGGGGPKINPLTGLSTDYLNHFTEAVMVLEMIGTMPECIDDLQAWQPKTYTEHFTASHFSNRETIIDAHRTADPAVREALDVTSELLNAMIRRARELMIRGAGTPEVEVIARLSLERLRPLLARAVAIINGTTMETANRPGPQAAIDAMFGR